MYTLWSKYELVILLSQRQVNNMKHYFGVSTMLFHCHAPLPVNLCYVNSLLCVVANKVIIYLLVLGNHLKL